MKKLTANLVALSILLLIFSHTVMANNFNKEYRLISTNGTNWDQVSEIPSAINFTFPRTTYSSSGNTNWTWSTDTQITLYKGDCTNSPCTNQNNLLFQGTVSNGINTTINALPPKMVYGQNAFMSLAQLKQICNATLVGNSNAIYTTQNNSHKIHFTLKAKGNRTTSGPALGGNSITEYLELKTKVDFDTNIICESIGNNPGEIEAEEIKIFLATNENAFTTPSAGVQCPKTKATIRVKANRSGQLPVSFHSRIGLGPATIQQENITVAMQADGTFVGRFEQWLEVNNSSVVNIKAQEVDNPYSLNDENLETPWKSISLVCAGAGGIGLSGIIPTTPTPSDTPTILSTTTPAFNDTKNKVKNIGLKSDGELVQAKKPLGLLGHELSHTQQQGRMMVDADLNEAQSKNSQTKKQNKKTIPLKNSATKSIQLSQINDKPTLFKGKLGEPCIKTKFPKNTVIIQAGKQRVVECIKGKATINSIKKVNHPWQVGDPVFSTPTKKTGPKKEIRQDDLGDEMPEDFPAG